MIPKGGYLLNTVHGSSRSLNATICARHRDYACANGPGPNLEAENILLTVIAIHVGDEKVRDGIAERSG